MNNDEIFDDPTFIAGMDLGRSLGRYDAEMSAKKAFEMGEIELWVEWVTPKSWAEWESWHEKYGEDFENRWKV